MNLLENFNRLATSVGEYIQNTETFKLFTLVLLFSDIDDIPTISRLRNSYLNIIRRRSNSLCHGAKSRDELKNFAFGNVVYSKFNECICTVKELAMIVRKLDDIQE